MLSSAVRIERQFEIAELGVLLLFPFRDHPQGPWGSATAHLFASSPNVIVRDRLILAIEDSGENRESVVVGEHHLHAVPESDHIWPGFEANLPARRIIDRPTSADT